MILYAINYIKTKGAHDGIEISIEHDINTEEGLVELCNSFLDMRSKYNVESIYEIVDLVDVCMRGDCDGFRCLW